MITSSYRAGSWFAIFGEAALLLLPGSEKARVGALWSSIDDGAGFEEVLDRLLQSGLGALPGFVLVSRGDGPTKLLARGAVLVTGRADDEELRIDGRDALTWVERSVAVLSSLRIAVGDDDDRSADGADAAAGPDGADGRDLPILGGLVRVARVDQPAVGAVEPDAPDEPDSVPTGLIDEPTFVPPTGPPPAGPPSGAPLTPLGPPRSTPPPVGPPLAAPPPLPPTPPPPTPAPASPPTSPPTWEEDPLSAPLPVDPQVVDHDGMTSIGSAGADLERELPGIPGQPAAPRIVPSVATLVFSSGEVVDVDRVILIGRAPEARRFTSTEQPRLVTVPSPMHEISSTHLEVRPGSGADHGSAVVTDMGSTNGTVLDQPGLGPESLKPGIAVQLIPGATINLGDGVSIQVARP